jgi:hypothetical protein
LTLEEIAETQKGGALSPAFLHFTEVVTPPPVYPQVKPPLPQPAAVAPPPEEAPAEVRETVRTARAPQEGQGRSLSGTR